MSYLRDRSLPHHGFLIASARPGETRDPLFRGVVRMPGDGPPPRALESQGKALAAAHAALEKQAEDVVVMDLRAISTVADFFVVCTAGTGRQMQAIKDHIETALHRHGCEVWHTEGSAAPARTLSADGESPQWVLMDCGDIVVHLLDQRARTFYRLEDLWADAPRVTVPAT